MMKNTRKENKLGFAHKRRPGFEKEKESRI